ncbi:hypothetical protein GOODEAATRI_033781 [Goodea atripinnis]|uniref:Uncharacterized protein n=1 Tax=Goodea atripinnis TaxID=208336 RepID=A0ABV0MMV9_9TELE
MALKRCIVGGMVASQRPVVPAALPVCCRPLLGRFLQTQRDSFKAVSAVRHYPHHQNAQAALRGLVKRSAAGLLWSIDSCDVAKGEKLQSLTVYGGETH